MSYILGIITGILLSGIALYGATRLPKAVSSLFTVSTINNSSTVPPEPVQMAQIIKRVTPQEKFFDEQ